MKLRENKKIAENHNSSGHTTSRGSADDRVPIRGLAVEAIKDEQPPPETTSTSW